MRKWIDLDADKVLQILLDHSGLTWSALCRECGFEPYASHPGPMQLYNCLWALCDAKLVSVDDIPKNKIKKLLLGWLQGQRDETKFRASDDWIKIQMTLNTRWMGTPRSDKHFSMFVQPRFGKPTDLPQKADIFALLPFKPIFRQLYENHICKVANQSQLSVARADDFLTANPIISDVWSGVCGAGVIVADCTGKDPNVFYEIGIAHTLGKTVVLITQNDEDVPDDVSHIKHIKYDLSPQGVKDFEQVLEKTLHTVMGTYTRLMNDDWAKNEKESISNIKQTKSTYNILAVFANPIGTDSLRLGAEDRVIRECIQISHHRDKLRLTVLHAATVNDLRRAFLNDKYDILHFSGHGTGQGLSLENEIGEVKLIPPTALARFCSDYSPPLHCVLLNACYSREQAEMVSSGVPYTIGMQSAISDAGAIEFTRGFYDALGTELSLELAFQEGIRSIELSGFDDAQKPILFRRVE